MLLNALIQLGLTEKEASVYMMLLRLGESPVSSLSKRLSLKRVTVYAVLDSLCKKNYVRYVRNGKCRTYIPHEPSCILESVERQSQNIKLQLSLAKECVTKLQAFPRLKPRTKKSTKVYYGHEVQDRLLRELSMDLDVYIMTTSDPNNVFLSSLLESNLRVRVLKLAPARGSLIVQEGKVMFLSMSEDAELTVQVDPIYSRLLIHLFQESNFTTTKI